jgi:hypothetical protein
MSTLYTKSKDTTIGNFIGKIGEGRAATKTQIVG